MTSSQHNNNDPRWGGRIPWYLRHPGAAFSGNVDSWLGLVGQRIERLFVFNEMGILNEAHFGSSLETETLGRFKFDLGRILGPQLRAYFEPESLRRDAQNDAMRDPEEQRSAAAELARRFGRKGGGPAAAPTMTPEEEDAEAFHARENARATRDARIAAHWASRACGHSRDRPRSSPASPDHRHPPAFRRFACPLGCPGGASAPGAAFGGAAPPTRDP